MPRKRPLPECCEVSPYCRCRSSGALSRPTDKISWSYQAARRTDAIGKAVETYGEAVRASSATWKPPKKVWTQRTKAEHRALRRKSPTTPMASHRVSSRKFDYKPSSKFSNNTSRRQRRHWERRPLKGDYSVTPKGNLAAGRAARFGVGTTLRTVGRAMPVIGYGALAHAILTDEEPGSRALKELMTFGMYSTMEYTKPQQAAAVSAVSDFWYSKYMDWWLAPLKQGDTNARV